MVDVQTAVEEGILQVVEAKDAPWEEGVCLESALGEAVR